jgi:hypothetical protein
MNDAAIRDLTLGSWAAGVWEKELRGVPLVFQEASMAYCMRQHSELREYWNRLGSIGSEDAKAVNILVHIYNDASVKLQIDQNNPPEIHMLYQLLRGRGITEMDALHAIASVLQEENWHSKNTGNPFDIQKYVEHAKSNVQAILDKPRYIRSSKLRPV